MLGRATTVAAAVWLLGCSSGGYVGLPTDLLLPGSAGDAAARDAASPVDGSAPVDAASAVDAALAPNSWTAFGQTFSGSSPICTNTDFGSGHTAYLVTLVTEVPYHCQLGVYFTSRPTTDGVYPTTATAPPALPADRAYALILDYRTGSYEAWNGIDGGQVVVRATGTALSIAVQDAVLRGGMPAGAPDERVSGVITCP